MAIEVYSPTMPLAVQGGDLGRERGRIDPNLVAVDDQSRAGAVCRVVIHPVGKTCGHGRQVVPVHRTAAARGIEFGLGVVAPVVVGGCRVRRHEGRRLEFGGEGGAVGPVQGVGVDPGEPGALADELVSGVAEGERLRVRTRQPAIRHQARRKFAGVEFGVGGSHIHAVHLQCQPSTHRVLDIEGLRRAPRTVDAGLAQLRIRKEVLAAVEHEVGPPAVLAAPTPAPSGELLIPTTP